MLITDDCLPCSEIRCQPGDFELSNAHTLKKPFVCPLCGITTTAALVMRSIFYSMHMSLSPNSTLSLSLSLSLSLTLLPFINNFNQFNFPFNHHSLIFLQVHENVFSSSSHEEKDKSPSVQQADRGSLTQNVRRSTVRDRPVSSDEEESHGAALSDDRNRH